MSATLTAGALSSPSADTASAALRSLGLAPSAWSAGPGAPFSAHTHPRDKILYCVAGSITFVTADGELALGPGDRLDLPGGAVHSADAGPAGVTCVEAFRP